MINAPKKTGYEKMMSEIKEKVMRDIKDLSKHIATIRKSIDQIDEDAFWHNYVEADSQLYKVGCNLSELSHKAEILRLQVRELYHTEDEPLGV